MFDHTAAGRSGSAPPPTGCEPETSGVSVMRPELRQTLPFACVFTAFRLCFHCLFSIRPCLSLLSRCCRNGCGGRVHHPDRGPPHYPNQRDDM